VIYIWITGKNKMGQKDPEVCYEEDDDDDDDDGDD